MSLLINQLCVNCDVCAPACPNEAIRQGEVIYEIDPRRCTECVGHFDEPQCAAVCPVDNCCISDPAYPEAADILLERAKTLNPDKTIDPAKVWSGVRN